MNSEILDLIRSRTKKDLKSLPEKGLKTAEEVAELNGCQLPLTSPATTQTVTEVSSGKLTALAIYCR